jgi:hypothetical protein
MLPLCLLRSHISLSKAIHLSNRIAGLDAWAGLKRVARLLLNDAAVGSGCGENILTLFGGSMNNKPQIALTLRCCGFCRLVRNQLSVCSILVNMMPHLTLM